MDDLKIKNPSGGLVLDAIKGVPIVPAYIDIRMVSSGIPSPRYENVTDRRRYLSDCKKNGVMPWTSFDFKLDTRAGVMVPRHQQNIVSVSSPEGLGEAVESLISGGKFYRIHLESECRNLFPNVLKAISKFSNGGYVPHQLFMDITQYHMTGYSQGDYGDSVLSLTHLATTGDSVLELKIRDVEISGEQKNDLKVWFSKLKRISNVN